VVQMKKRILKIGDKIYSQSLQNFDGSYLVGFPQREQQLLNPLSELVDIDFYNHKSIENEQDIAAERQKLTNFLSTKDFDYILVDNPFSVLVIEPQVSTPIIFDCIDWYEEMYLKEFGEDDKYLLLKRGLTELLKRADKVVAQSPVILNELIRLGLTTNKHVVIPNGYDSDKFFPYDKEKINEIKKYIEQKYHCDLTSKKVVVYVGKLGFWYDKIITIANSIPDGFVFLIVGDGPIKDQIPNHPNVIKCGAVELSKVPEFNNVADVLVFPVDVDCSPIAISEYLAVGKPIVMGKGRMEWLLQDGVTGYMVENTIESWRTGIEKAVKMGNEVKDFNLNLAKNLSWDLLAKKLAEFIEK